MGDIWTKPPVGTQIDWSNPLTWGMIAALPCNEGSGTSTINAVTGRSCLFQGTSKALWYPSPGGPSIGNEAGTSAIYGINDGSFSWSNHSVTIAAWMSIYNLASTQIVFSTRSSGGYSSYNYSIQMLDWRVIAAWGSYASGYTTIEDYSGWVTKKPYLFVVTATATSVFLYIDGVLKSSSAHTLSPETITGLTWGYDNSAAPDPNYSSLITGAVWNYPMSAAQVAALNPQSLWSVYQSATPWYLIEHSLSGEEADIYPSGYRYVYPNPLIRM
jgi:hypothetical protein